MTTVLPYSGQPTDLDVPLAIIGAGAAGLCAALAAREAGVEAFVIERDAAVAGSTALSAGLIPAAGTRFQREKGIADDPELFASDIHRKSNRQSDPALVETVAREAGPLVEWLADRWSFPFDVIDNFNYPGHSAFRMHGLPTRTGTELVNRLRAAAESEDITILTSSRADRLLVAAEARVRCVELVRADGARERLGCSALVLACNGFGGNRALVEELIPEMKSALYFGHPGNQGDAVAWARALDAQLAHLGAYQGHGSVATPQNVLITWAVIMQGGIQINSLGRRFCDETRGYSEQAAEVLRQPGQIAWNVFDKRIADIARQFEDFRIAENAGAVLTAGSLPELAARMQVPLDAIAAELREIESCKSSGAPDRFDRIFPNSHHLAPPWHAVKVTGALFHTQGGLATDTSARVKRRDGTLFTNLFAAGGAAAGVSGDIAAGYLSGNGLLTATVLGRVAGRAAASLITRDR